MAIPISGTVGITLAGGAGSFLTLSRGASFDFSNSGWPPTLAQVSIPSALAYTNFINAIGPSTLSDLNTSTFTGAGVAGTTGVRAKLVGPVYVSGGANACNSIFPGSSNCQITQGAQDSNSDSQTTPLPAASGGTGLSALGTGVATALGNNANSAGGLTTSPVPVANGGTSATAAGATAVGNISGATPVASCSGTPTSSFAVTNGIVTHC